MRRVLLFFIFVLLGLALANAVEIAAPVKGVTTRQEIEKTWEAPAFKKEQDRKEYYYYEFDDGTGYVVMSFNSENILDYYSTADKTMTIACPNCLAFLSVLVRHPFAEVYTCNRCGHKFTKTEGIGARNRQAREFMKTQMNLPF